MDGVLDHTHEHYAGALAAEPDAVVATSGISSRLWRLYAQFWLVCLLFPILFLVQTPLSAARLFAAASGLVLYVGAYTWIMWPHPANRPFDDPARSRGMRLLFAGLVGLALALTLFLGSPFLWLFVGVSAAVGIVLAPGSAFWVVMALTLVTLGLGIGLSGGLAQTDWLHLVPLVLLVRGLGLDMAGLTRLSGALRELHQARGALARQAVSEERLRLARDLHDLLGHTLSVIALKSELAGRLIDRDPVQAAHEIREVEQEARGALREVRQAVAGYRQPTLSSELDGARQVLAAAGVACTIENTAGVLPASADAVLAWVVREGITNVLRHSRARTCSIRVHSDSGIARLEIDNDDYGIEEQAQALAPPGSGLAGLAERVSAQGGQLESGSVSMNEAPGFRLQVVVPLSGSRADLRETAQ